MKWLMLLSVFFISSVHADPTYTRALCVAQGNNVGGNDSGPFTTDARMVLTLTLNDDSTLAAAFEGTLMVAHAFSSNGQPLELNPTNAYIAMFDTRTAIAENVNYRPIKYKGYAQFPDLRAVYTVGLESDMWGEFVVDREFANKADFHAAYIFQAGDHMGGTIHFKCTP